MPELVFSVSEVGKYLQRALQLDAMLTRIRVRGEVSNCKTYPSGHTYFTLKDETATLRCVWFKFQKPAGSLLLEDGMRIVVTGSISFYERDGNVQLVLTGAMMDGIGAWYERYKRLEARLEAEGLFAPEKKRPIPAARRIGVVTSPAGAVFHDICQVASRRDPRIEILLYPVQVQGEHAAANIAAGIRWFGAHPWADVLIIGRGGGSAEDLWPFSEEIVVRAVTESPLPVVSAVGHETDYSLCDRAADLRAPTPSAAAELVVANIGETLLWLEQVNDRLYSAIQKYIADKDKTLQIRKRLLRSMEPLKLLLQREQILNMLFHRVRNAMCGIIAASESSLQMREQTLHALNPRGILDRGYAILTNIEGKLIREAVPGERVIVETDRSFVKATVNSIEVKENTDE